MSADTYSGITSEYTALFKASGSKFYGYLFPVDSLKDFNQRIKAFKAEFSDATHVCSGAVIGVDREIQRFSDDGEPSNSAGRPILHALLSSNMSFVGCAVVRYYGGKKLGIPGLIEAYGGCAKLCVDQAEIKDLQLMEDVVCSIQPHAAYKLYNYLSKFPHISYEVNGNEFRIRCTQSMTEALRLDLEKMDTLDLQ